MKFSLRRRLQRYLIAVHQADKCLGPQALHRTNSGEVPWPRTTYRWRRRLKDRLAYFPAYTLEELGLVHLHLFITNPDSSWSKFPYAVESLWVTQNLVDPVLYLHCFVPLAHRERIDRLLGQLQIPHHGLHTLWSCSSWQRLHLGQFESLSHGFPGHRWPTAHDGRVPAKLALAIPVLVESWNQQTTLNEIWQRLHDRLGVQLNEYFQGRRPYTVNGKSHVKETYAALAREGLFRQYLIRFQDSCSLFVVSPSYRRSLPQEVSKETRIAELFPTSDGGGFWRLHGSWELLRARASLAACTVYLIEDGPRPEVRFCYEWLFDPASSCWKFSATRIRRHMEARS